MKKVKQISWSYPTSDNARRAGMYDTGCYSVCRVDYNKKGERQPPIFIQGFATLDEAIAYSDALPYERDYFCITNSKFASIV